MLKNDCLNVPTSDRIFLLESDKIYEYFLPLIKKYTIECLNELYAESYILSKIELINSIEINEEIDASLNISFEDGILKLPKIFFLKELNSQDDVQVMLDKFPDLMDLLTTIGVYVVASDIKDNEKDLKVKRFISSYIVAREHSAQNKVIIGKKFLVRSNNKAIQENVINQLSMILGEEIMYEAYLKGYDYLVAQINNLTSSRRLGQKILDDLFLIDNLIENMMNYEHVLTISKPILEKIELLEVNKFSIEQLKEHILIERDVNLSSEDVDFIKWSKEVFIDRFLKYEQNGMVELYFPNIPRKKEGKKYVYDLDSLSFIDIIQMNAMLFNSSYKVTKEEFEIKWQYLQKKIYNQVIPKHVIMSGNNGLDIDTVMSFAKWSDDNNSFDIKENSLVKSLKRNMVK